MQKKIKLIYIASNGRSGSTLLDMLIGKHKSCFTLGEFQVLPIDKKISLAQKVIIKRSAFKVIKQRILHLLR